MEQKQTGAAYAFWFLCLFSICGVQRFYVGRPVSGIIYLFTFGVFGIGQFLDLFLLPSMVEEKNRKFKEARYGNNPAPSPQVIVNIGEHYNFKNPANPSNKDSKSQQLAPDFEQLDRIILKLCQQKEEVTLVDCLIEIEDVPKNLIKARLETLVYEDLLEMNNRITDGTIVYKLKA